MNIKNPKFEISAVGPKQYPNSNLPEIVLVGKSNVGKSSFVNTMICLNMFETSFKSAYSTFNLSFKNVVCLTFSSALPSPFFSTMADSFML